MAVFTFLVKILLLLTAVCSISAMPFYALVDLTYNFDNATLYWPTAKKFTRKGTENDTNGVWRAMGEFCTSEHSGTHMDAPYHFAQGKRTISDIPLELLRGPAVVINIEAKAKRDSDALVTVEDIKAWEKKYGPMPLGSIVLMNSGWGKRWPNFSAFFGIEPSNLETFHFPGFSPEVAEFLVNKRSIIGVGVDTPSLDNGPSKSMMVHRTFAKSNIFGIEYLANMDKLPAKGALVYAIPMKIAGGSGAPARVFARIPPSVISHSSITTLHYNLFCLTIAALYLA